jgi:hypothetical protein
MDSVTQLLANTLFLYKVISSKEIHVLERNIVCNENNLKCVERMCEVCSERVACDPGRITATIAKYWQWEKVQTENGYQSTRCIQVIYYVFYLKQYETVKGVFICSITTPLSVWSNYLRNILSHIQHIHFEFDITFVKFAMSAHLLCQEKFFCTWTSQKIGWKTQDKRFRPPTLAITITLSYIKE